jgi:hypothetical protein
MRRFFVDKVKNLNRPVRSKKLDRFQLCPTPSPTHPHPKIGFESGIEDIFVSLDITFIKSRKFVIEHSSFRNEKVFRNPFRP